MPRKLHGRDDVVFVDIRDPREQQREGKMPGAFSCTRGMLEFWIDPESPYHKPVFAQDKKFVFFCAGGWRSALAAQTAQRMGMKPVAHIKGGFSEWKKIRQAGGHAGGEAEIGRDSFAALIERSRHFACRRRAGPAMLRSCDGEAAWTSITSGATSSPVSGMSRCSRARGNISAT